MTLPIRVEVCLGETDATPRPLVSPVHIAAPNTEWRTAAPGSHTEAMVALAEATLRLDYAFHQKPDSDLDEVSRVYSAALAAAYKGWTP